MAALLAAPALAEEPVRPQLPVQQHQQQFPREQQQIFSNQQQQPRQQQPFINPQQQQQQQFPQQQGQPQLPQQRQQFSFSDGHQQPNLGFAFPQQAPSTPSTTPQPPPALQSFPRQSFSVSSSSTSSEDALRQGKIVGSIQPPAQVIQKSPASEIESSKQAEAKDKAAKGKDKDKDEYVVYYYYYYDDDNKKNNLSLNFDDVPNLEGFDKADGSKLKGKGSSQRLASPNPQNRFEPKTVTTSPPSGQQQAPPAAFPSEQAAGVTSAPQTVTQVSVSVSVSEGTHVLLPSQPFEAKRPPLAGPPNLEFTGAKLVPDPGVPIGPAPEVRGLVTPQGAPVSTASPPADAQGVNEISGRKGADLLTTSVETTTPTTTTTTTEPTTTLAPTTTTTEEPTTTEKTKRPFGNRRRFGGPHGASPHHARGHGPRKSHTTSTTSTTPATPSTRRLLGGLRRNRPTPRPSGRLQFGRRPSPIHSRHHKEEEPEEEEKESTSPAEAEPTTTTAAPASSGKKRFGGSSRFGGKSGRTRGSGTSATAASSTTAAPKRPVGRPSSGALFGRTNRGPRPRAPFSRHRPGAKKVEEEEKPEENEESSPVTTPENKEEASAASTETASKHEEAAPSESEATSEDSHATEAPAVTPESKPAHGRNRFGSRPRTPLFGGRPRPTLGR
ncbi:hypothetical protein V5799_001017 [Amblyomma americanum]|uniref:Uncharacterized protein n=1 Tax=Amblyomma americanum TaxID=6943 RepID=A0AAQ4D1E4_AMBAM